MNALKTPNPDLFRAYDVRGIVGESLMADDFRSIGQAFGSYVAEALSVEQPSIIVMRDGRLSSPLLAGAMMEGLLAAGCHVRDGGIGPTPLCYYATHSLEAHGSVMITGSHNPPKHNGAKFMVGHASLYGKHLATLGPMVTQGKLREGVGALHAADVLGSYIDTLAKVHDADGVSIVWDTGHGAAGDVVKALTEALPRGTHHLLYNRIDGRFPAHHPDPSDPSTLADLQAAVLEHNADIGIAFDGDGDRVGFVDHKGRILSPDHTLMLLARDVLARKKGSQMIADVKTSDAFFADVEAHGGQSLMWQTGHALIKEKLQETGAAFAGEASGHIFFADEYYGFDDGIYAAMRMIAMRKISHTPLSDLVDALPQLHASDEMRIPCDDRKKFAVIRDLTKALEDADANVNTLDGVRVSTDDGWWLMRASNTQAVLVVRYEGRDEAAAQRLREEVNRYLSDMDVAQAA